MTERFPNTYANCNYDLDKFLLLLRKEVYPYEYMDRCLDLMKLKTLLLKNIAVN